MTEINRVLKVAAIQPDILWENIGGNLEKYRKILDTLSSDIDLVVLPEMFTTGFSMNPEKLAEDMNGTTMTWAGESLIPLRRIYSKDRRSGFGSGIFLTSAIVFSIGYLFSMGIILFLSFENGE